VRSDAPPPEGGESAQAGGEPFRHDELLAIVEEALAASLGTVRRTLIAGLPPEVTGHLPEAATPHAEMLEQLVMLNGDGWSIDAGRSLEGWLSTALSLARPRTGLTRLEDALRRVQLRRRLARAPVPPAGALPATASRPALIKVEGATTWLGCEDGARDEAPPHEVRLSPFWMAETPVTRAHYATLLGRAPQMDDGYGSDHPVVFVSWLDAVRYCNALSGVEGLPPAYRPDGMPAGSTPDGYRLPTEAEWEHACRAGTKGSWCRDLGSLHLVSWYGETSAPRAYPVGKKLPNALGIRDMHGNVAEWCDDRYGPYDANPLVDPRGPAAGATRVVRGGSTWSRAEWVRSASRDKRLPRTRSRDLGFRVVRPDS
jgi:formylglycine-generating enzyme